MKQENNLIMFYGSDCPACNEMKELINKLYKDRSITIELRDIWTGRDKESNYRMFENYMEVTGNTGTDCDGLPFCINTQTHQFLCGVVSYDDLVLFAQEEKSI